MRSCLFIATLWLSAGEGLLTSWLLFVMYNCVFVTFQCGFLGHVPYLIVSIPDLCRLSYFARTGTSPSLNALNWSIQRKYAVINFKVTIQIVTSIYDQSIYINRSLADISLTVQHRRNKIAYLVVHHLPLLRICTKYSRRPHVVSHKPYATSRNVPCRLP